MNDAELGLGLVKRFGFYVFNAYFMFYILLVLLVLCVTSSAHTWTSSVQKFRMLVSRCTAQEYDNKH